MYRDAGLVNSEQHVEVYAHRACDVTATMSDELQYLFLLLLLFQQKGWKFVYADQEIVGEN